MGLNLFLNLERRAFYTILLSVIGILWYVCMWGIFDESIDYIHKKYRFSKRCIYVSIIALLLLIVLIHPTILKSL